MNRQSEIEETASLWIVREDRGLTAEETELERLWLDESAEHLVVYLRLKSLWCQSDALADAKVVPSTLPVRRSFSSARIPLIAATLVICMVGGTVEFYRGSQHLAAPTTAGQQYSTGSNQKKTVSLADGTRIELNRNTRVVAQDTAGGRTVQLDHGEVYFEVVHNAARPFTVFAGDRRITDLGTKFLVSRENDYVKVVVMEGKVRIDLLGTQPVAPVIANEGHVAVIQGDETLVAVKDAREIEDELNWRSQMLVFDQEPLADVAAQFNRYNKRQILVEGEAKKIRIGGRFQSDNIEAFVLLMQKALKLKVTENREQILISDQ